MMDYFPSIQSLKDMNMRQLRDNYFLEGIKCFGAGAIYGLAFLFTGDVLSPPEQSYKYEHKRDTYLLKSPLEDDPTPPRINKIHFGTDRFGQLVSIEIEGGLKFGDTEILQGIKASLPASTETLVLEETKKIVAASVDVIDPYASSVTFTLVDTHLLTWGLSKPDLF